MEEKIKLASKALEPITYEPHSVGYYVLMNGKDIGGEDYCETCIKDEVKRCREQNKERRVEIIKSHDKLKLTGKYTEKEISQSLKQRLKEYPSRATFTYAGHDPDFGGGCKEPNTCDGCGEPFQTEFVADKEEAERLLRATEIEELSERDKWEIEVAFYHYIYSKPDAQEILSKIADNILRNANTPAENI